MKQEMTRWQWHQLYHMQIISTLLQADNYTSTSSLNITGRLLFLTPNAENLYTVVSWQPRYSTASNHNRKLSKYKPAVQVQMVHF